ncbi:hypothetical protein O9929_01400 [Vibrio lentus]|nr:hypothetical protein [Vibrio lentus]
MAGEATASAVLGVTEQMLKQFGHQEFAFDAEQAQSAAVQPRRCSLNMAVSFHRG